ncbi:MAG TPA: N-acetyltransferase [Microvirga sp.]|jgi:N-acetylglutamate synthase|nr:N-acetyltransferase [Microvirga sp.]
MEPLLAASRIRSVEEACLNGWPSLRGIVYDGWLLRFADGYTRRTNSVHLLTQGSLDPAEKAAACEAIYAAQGLPPIFCLSSATPSPLGAILDGRGYEPPEDETRVLYRDLSGDLPRPGGVELTEGRPSEAWLAALARLQDQGDRAQGLHRRILEALCVPAAFAAAVADARLAALAFGAVHDRIVCVNSVATDPAFRRRGLARQAIAAILAWAQERCGATGACVPVVAANGPAVALYEGLGFRTEAFRYHYRRRPGAGEI